jgi:hypothetical protein
MQALAGGMVISLRCMARRHGLPAAPKLGPSQHHLTVEVGTGGRVLQALRSHAN